MQPHVGNIPNPYLVWFHYLQPLYQIGIPGEGVVTVATARTVQGLTDQANRVFCCQPHDQRSLLPRLPFNMAEAFFAISSSRVSRPIMRSNSAILARSWLLCSLVWKSWGAFSRNSTFHRATVWGLRLYCRQASARLVAPLISSNTTRALSSGVNLRRTAMFLPSSWTS